MRNDKYVVANSHSATSYVPLQPPATGGLPPQLYLYILGELAIPEASRRPRVSTEYLHQFLFSLSLLYRRDVSPLVKVLGFPTKLYFANYKPIDKRHYALFDLVAESPMGESLPFILSHVYKAKSVDAKQKSINKYIDGKLTVHKTVHNGTLKPVALCSFIMDMWNVDCKTSLTLIAALGGLTNRVNGIINERYGHTTSNVTGLIPPFKMMFEIVGPIYYLKEGEDMIDEMMVEYLDYLDGKVLKTGVKFYRTQSLVVLKEDFAKMSLRGKMIIMRNLHHYEDGKIYVHMKTRQSYGNYGRQNNVLTELSRDDRKTISNLYGYDMDAALQTILFRIFQPRGHELPYTYKYIINKQGTRSDLAAKTGLSNDGVKALITSVYQGLKWGGKNHKYLDEIMEDAAVLRQAIMDLEPDDEVHSQALKYATHACKHSKKIKMTRLQYERSTSKSKRRDYETTFMFHFWTFYEREIQNIIASHFSQPRTLHDAVYTQNIEEFRDFNVGEVENEIAAKTGIRMGVSIV